MKLRITSSGEDIDDHSVKYLLQAEIDTHKTSLEFYEYADFLNDFAEKLTKLPLQSREDVIFKLGYWDNSPYELFLKASLANNLGGIELRVETNDIGENNISKIGEVVEVQAIQRLSKFLLGTDFAHSSEMVWVSQPEQP